MTPFRADTHFVAGVLSRSPAESLALHSPIDMSVLTEARLADDAMAEAAVAGAVEARDAAERSSMEMRAKALRSLADGLDARDDELAELAALEIGCPIAQARALQVHSASGMLRATADLALRHGFEEERAAARGGRLWVRKVPVGVAVGIVAWNVPLFLACEKLGAAVAAGCPIVIKASPENARTMHIFAELLSALDLPAGMVSLLTADRDLGRRLVADPRVAKVSFTGSTEAGRSVATVAAQRFARCTLELGGKSAAILLDDVDIAAKSRELFLAMVQNNGQVCGAQSRVLVPASAPYVRDALRALFDALVVGDPRDPETDIGPLATPAQAEKVRRMTAEALADGAECVAGADAPRGACYVAPALMAVDASARLAREEVFGPVTALIGYGDIDEAVSIANDSSYGLSGSVWSPDITRATAIARRLRTGTVGLNSRRILDFAAPFGGHRASGIGRELGPEGIDGYLETTSILLPEG